MLIEMTLLTILIIILDLIHKINIVVYLHPLIKLNALKHKVKIMLCVVTGIRKKH